MTIADLIDKHFVVFWGLAISWLAIWWGKK